MRGRGRIALGCAVLVATAAACSSPAPPVAQDPAGRDRPAEGSPALDGAAGSPTDFKRDYLALQQRAMRQIRDWSAAGGGLPDPRPAWAGRLESFAREHPGTAEAADALQGAMQIRAGMLDYEGFFRTYDLMLEIAPDSPVLPAVFSQVSMMRMARAGRGAEILQTRDLESKRAAWDRAVPKIAGDLERAIAATKAPATVAAAHYTLGMTYYQLDVDLAKALEHFRVVAEQHPDFSFADSARVYIRELETLAVGRPAPDFEAVGLDGRKVALSSLRGKVVLVDFWATWCEPCIWEMPDLRRAYRKYKDRGFTIVGITIDTDNETVVRFLKEHGIRWAIVSAGPEESESAAAEISRGYCVQSLPMSYLVDRKGTIRGRALFGSQVERAVGELLGG